jgi:hypothetical protein
MSLPNVARARAAWGGDKTPDWIEALAGACDLAKSQGQVAKRLGVSPTQVNQAIGNLYKGRLERLEQRVRGELMKETVSCPVLGPLSRRDCLDFQRRKFRATNPLRVLLHQTCPTCPNREDACSSRD